MSTAVLVAATRNPAKLAEFTRLVWPATVIVPAPHDISPETEPEPETGDIDTIAVAKAIAWSRVIGGAYVIASDGGLLIPGLRDRWNPVRTRRFAGDAIGDVVRAEALLDLASDLDGDERQIGWREAVAVASGGLLLASWAAESAPGLLARSVDPDLVRAGNGFWIPAVWECPEYGNRLLAELSSEERAARDDHWNRLREPVREWLSQREVRNDEEHGFDA